MCMTMFLMHLLTGRNIIVDVHIVLARVQLTLVFVLIVVVGYRLARVVMHLDTFYFGYFMLFYAHCTLVILDETRVVFATAQH